MKGRMRRYQELASQDQDPASRNKTTNLLKQFSALPGMSLPIPDSLIVRDSSLTARAEANELMDQARFVAPINLVALSQPQNLGAQDVGSVGLQSLPPPLSTLYTIPQKSFIQSVAVDEIQGH